MPGILKVGMTERTPEARLSEANASDTWRPPTPYKIEFAKKVSNPDQWEKKLHVLLEKFTDRINPRREFFRVSQENVRLVFDDWIDGEIWAGTREEEEEDEDQDTSESAPRTKATSVTGCRDMAKCFKDGQRIRHTIKSINDTWIGTYDSSKNGIVYDGEILSLNQFALRHIKTNNPDRKAVSAWDECQCEVDGEWRSIDSLPEL